MPFFHLIVLFCYEGGYFFFLKKGGVRFMYNMSARLALSEIFLFGTFTAVFIYLSISILRD